MQRRNLLVSAFVMATMAAAVYASSVHYKKGPSCVDNGVTATCTGTLAGLGNEDIKIQLAFPNATATTICSNPQGQQSPGQNPAAPVDVTGTVFATAPKNGTLSFTVTTTAPQAPSWDVAGCPNSKWTVSIDNVTFGTGTLTIEQPVGTTVLTTGVFLP
jgi:hypothetical protein